MSQVEADHFDGDESDDSGEEEYYDDATNAVLLPKWDRILRRGIYHGADLQGSEGGGCYYSRKQRHPSYFSELHFASPVPPTKTVEERRDLNKKVSIWHGIITNVQTCSIVTGVYPYLDDVESMIIHETRMGDGPWKDSTSVMPTVVTSTKATNLPAKRILWVKVAKCEKALSPSQSEVSQMELCYTNVLTTAVALGCRSIALPVLGGGDDNMPYITAASIAAKAVRQWLEINSSKVDVILLVTFPIPALLSSLVDAMKIQFPGRGSAPVYSSRASCKLV